MPANVPFRILFECTPTAQTDLTRGIPRVVRNIVRHGPDVISEYGGSVSPLVYAYGSWTEARWAKDASVATFDNNRSRNSAEKSRCRAVPAGPLRRLFFPPPGRNGIRKVPRWIAAESCRLWDHCARPHIRPGAHDVVLILDPWWRCPEAFWRTVAKARRDGAHVGTVVYDLIPITHPEFVGSHHVERFRRWLHRAADQSDFFLAISETVKNELRDYLHHSYPGPAWSDERFHSFMLGADIPVHTGKAVRPSVQRIFEAGNTYLMVGAVDRRKNYPFLVDAFEKLWNRGLDVRLCLVGSFTKALPELHSRIVNHVEVGRRLFYCSDLNDTELDYCYRNARTLVYPSIVEGFGLPIVEALQHGRSVLASDTAIHREVGGEFCAYFGLSSTAQLVEMIAQCERLGRVPNVRSAAEYIAPTWKSSCRELIDTCCRYVGTRFLPAKIPKPGGARHEAKELKVCTEPSGEDVILSCTVGQESPNLGDPCGLDPHEGLC